MNRLTTSHPSQRGFGLVEVMVGFVIGLIAVLVIYQVYTVAEGFKRNTTAAGEAQQSGLFSTFVLGMEIGNGGAGLAVSAQDLASCPDPGGAMPQRFAQSFRPIPVVITDGGAGNSDTFVVNYSMATTLSNTALFTGNAAPGVAFPVQSPGGFHVNDIVVGISAPTVPNSPCASSKVTAVSAPDGNGIVTITQSPLFPAGGIDFFGSSTLFNMGPCSRAQKVQYSVVNNVLYATPLIDTGAANCGQLANPLVPNPLASNILIMKVEYGIDSNLDPKRLLDTWVQATAGGGWDAATLMPAPITQINQIKAIRIGIIVQSEQFDKDLAGYTGGDYSNGDYNWVLFDCADANKANCPGRLTGSVPAQISPAGNWRFRKYETVIPLRNEIWNKT
jgi:type IV pilus assembly protein PilW